MHKIIINNGQKVKVPLHLGKCIQKWLKASTYTYQCYGLWHDEYACFKLYSSFLDVLKGYKEFNKIQWALAGQLIATFSECQWKYDPHTYTFEVFGTNYAVFMKRHRHRLHQLQRKNPNHRIFCPISRYDNLTRLIKNNKCQTILEIGTYGGARALTMLKAASKPKFYYGFDLWEQHHHPLIDGCFTEKLVADERRVLDRLARFKGQFRLIKGDSRATLPKFNTKRHIDFIFIDGSHDPRIIQDDWNNLQKFIDQNTHIVFDDYYLDFEKFGCKTIIDALDPNKWYIRFLQPVLFNDNGQLDRPFQMVYVRLR